MYNIHAFHSQSDTLLKTLKVLIENRFVQLQSGYIAIVDDDTSGHDHRSIEGDSSDNGMYCI